jgi:hypothetical protein
MHGKTGLEIICVVANAGICRENTYVVRDYCKGRGITFATRIFDPMLYELDNKLIGSIPGFHLYKDGVYQRSFGLESDIEDVCGSGACYGWAWGRMCTCMSWLSGICLRSLEKSTRNKV